MKIKFLGATQEVTGSNYLVECCGKKVFVDCGVHQGRDEDEKNRTDLSIHPGELDALLLTHSHMDHSGRIPYLVRQGFKGKIWATKPAADLLGVLWYDSARLMKEEAEWKNRKSSRKNLLPIEPLYDENDVANALKLLQPVEYESRVEIFPGIEACFYNAGHILGSASISLVLKESDSEVRIVFSGDLGQQEAVMERSPAVIQEAHYVLVESTYGDRRHKDLAETRAEFREIITLALKDKGKVLIPSFVIDRAQRILYELLLMQIEGLIDEDLPVFFDSPMGVKATEFYRQYTDTLSDEIQRHIAQGHNPFEPKGLHFVESPEQSRKINDIPFGIVIAGSGMCSGGRIVHHLKHGVWNPKNHVIFVGYQGYGTLGRRLVDGETELRIAGEEVQVKAKIHTIGGFSAHGDRDDLLAWAANFKANPLFFVTHGERAASHSLAASLQEAGMRSLVPMKGQEFTLWPEVIFKGDEPVATLVRTEKPVFTASKIEAAAALEDIERLAAELRSGLKQIANVEDLIPLLLTSRTLLETTSDKAKK